MASGKNRQHDIYCYKYPGASVLVDSDGRFGCARTGLDKDASGRKVTVQEVPNRPGEDSLAVEAEEPLGEILLMLLGPMV
jgi:hypothetical protein